jgi:hypothetical protein
VEMGRLNGQSPPWTMLAVVLSGVAISVWASLAANKRVVERIEQRKRALGSMRAALEENT